MFQQGHSQQTVHLVVVYEQHPGAVDMRRACRRVGRAEARESPRQGDINPEQASLARLALGADLSPHQRDDLLAKGKSEAAATKSTGDRSVRLLEYLEQLVLGRQFEAAASILHLDPKCDPVLIDLHPANLERDCATVRELERVRKQVLQDQTKPARIPLENPARNRIHIGGEAKLLLFGHWRQKADRVIDTISDPKVDHFQFNLIRFQFREVENVVDELEQGFRRKVNRVGEAALLNAKLRPQQQFRHADDAVHGRANFVAHIRQELRLGQVRSICLIPEAGCFGHVAGGRGNLHLQRLLRRLAFRDVGHDTYYLRGKNIALTAAGPATYLEPADLAVIRPADAALEVQVRPGV